MSERFNVGYCGSMLPQYPPNWLSEINVTFYSVTLAGRYSSLMMVLRAETCRSVLMLGIVAACCHNTHLTGKAKLM